MIISNTILNPDFEKPTINFKFKIFQPHIQIISPGENGLIKQKLFLPRLLSGLIFG